MLTSVLGLSVGILAAAFLVIFTLYGSSRDGKEGDLSDLKWLTDTEDGSLTKEKFIYYKNSVLIIWAGVLLIMYIILSIRKTLFVRMSEGLTCSVRKELLKAIFHKQVSWFDNETHAPGVISSLMTDNITQLNGMTSEFFAVVLESVLIILIAICTGCLISWQ